jgi:hypothetical protein
MHYMSNNMQNMQNVNMQNNMQINMQNMQTICRFGADCLVLTVICRICQIICFICRICYGDFQYAQYALPTLLMQDSELVNSFGEDLSEGLVSVPVPHADLELRRPSCTVNQQSVIIFFLVLLTRLGTPPMQHWHNCQWLQRAHAKLPLVFFNSYNFKLYIYIYYNYITL